MESVLKFPPPDSLSVRDRLLGEIEADDLALSKIISLFRISDSPEILDAIHKFKYTGIRQIGSEFGTMLSKLINPLEYDYIVPIPIHHARKRERGFNQSEIMAEVISKRTSIPIDYKTLRRKQYTYSQAKLDRHERRINLLDKFIIAEKNKITDMQLLLIDDVLTTATTANYCAELLLKAGARKVDIAVIAVSY